MEKFSHAEKTNNDNTIPEKTIPEFLEPSEDSLYLEDNKRIKDINNTHTRDFIKELLDRIAKESENEDEKSVNTMEKKKRIGKV